jgi:hypothetical protein
VLAYKAKKKKNDQEVVVAVFLFEVKQTEKSFHFVEH